MALESKVYETLKAELNSSRPGEKLATVRELMVRFNTTQFAVQSSLTKLKDEGIIKTQVGKGSFVAGSGSSDDLTDLIKDRAPSVLLVTHVMKSGRGKHVAAAIYDNLVEAGCSVIAISYNDIKSLSSVLGDNRFDLCLIQPRRSVLSVGLLAALKKAAKHVIVEGRNLEQADVDIIYRDRFSSVRLAFSHLKTLGHSNIGLISEKNSNAVGYQEIKQIFQLYCDGASVEKAPIIESPCVDAADSNCSKELAENLLKAKREMPNFPSAFIVSGHFTGDDIVQAFKAIKLNVPKDVSVIRLRIVDDLIGEDSYFSSVARSSEHIASSIRKLFEWRLENPLESPITFLDLPDLVVGKSTIPFN